MSGEGGRWGCPLCGREGVQDERPPAEIGGLVFVSIRCDLPPTDITHHPFPVRWLESEVLDLVQLREFKDRFVYVRGPLPDGSPIESAFGDTDPIRAWIEDEPMEEGRRVLIRL